MSKVLRAARSQEIMLSPFESILEIHMLGD